MRAASSRSLLLLQRLFLRNALRFFLRGGLALLRVFRFLRDALALGVLFALLLGDAVALALVGRLLVAALLLDSLAGLAFLALLALLLLFRDPLAALLLLRDHRLIQDHALNRRGRGQEHRARRQLEARREHGDDHDVQPDRHDDGSAVLFGLAGHRSALSGLAASRRRRDP